MAQEKVIPVLVKTIKARFAEVPTFVPLDINNEGVQALAETAIHLAGYYDQVWPRVRDAVTRDENRQALTPELVWRTCIDVGMERENPSVQFRVLSELDTEFGLLVSPQITAGALTEKFSRLDRSDNRSANLPLIPAFWFNNQGDPPPWNYIMAKIILADPDNQSLLNAVATHIFPKKQDYYSFAHDVPWEKCAGDTKNQAAEILAEAIEKHGLQEAEIKPRWQLRNQ